MLCGDLNGKEIQKKRRYMYMYSRFMDFPGGWEGKESDAMQEIQVDP